MNTAIMLTLEQWATKTTQEKNDFINVLVQDLYAQHRSILPMHPWALVFVLPREQKLGMLYLPGSQHKVTLEGIVLATWAPWTEERGIREKGVEKTRLIVHKSDLEIGEHVLFPHWSGLPIPGMDERYFRMVKECGWAKNEEGGIYGVVVYSDVATSIAFELRELLAEALAGYSATRDEDVLAGLIAAKLEQRFLLVDRQRASVTLSALHGKA